MPDFAPAAGTSGAQPVKRQAKTWRIDRPKRESSPGPDDVLLDSPAHTEHA